MTDPYALMVRFYDRWSVHMTADIPFYIARAREVAPGPIVELGAGNGRVALEIARAGIDVIAVEPSAPMREDGARRATEAGLTNVRFVEGDMRSFVADPPVDLVIIPFRSFQHLMTVEDQRAALDAIFRSLRPGGRLILNMFTLDPVVAAAREGVRGHRFSYDDADGHHEAYGTPRYAPATQSLTEHVEHELWRDERLVATEEADLRLRIVGRYEMQHLLERAGFEIVSLEGGFAGEEYGPGPDEMVWTARRP
jgi:SAM-dependent methyltransferase